MALQTTELRIPIITKKHQNGKKQSLASIWATHILVRRLSISAIQADGIVSQVNFNYTASRTCHLAPVLAVPVTLGSVSEHHGSKKPPG